MIGVRTPSGCSRRHPVVEVDSGRAALETLLTQTFALILMDVRMPTMNGFETAKLWSEHRAQRDALGFVVVYHEDRRRRHTSRRRRHTSRRR
jgi:CheY-like chemotaxis protein